MIRLYFVVEGQTEYEFVRTILEPHLRAFGVSCYTTIVGTPRRRRSTRLIKGGGHWGRWRRDLLRILRGQKGPDLRVTTLFDLYGLPRGFPGLETYGSETNTNRRCDQLQSALAKDIDDRRLTPYIQRHEFEALVLAALAHLRGLLDAEGDITGLDNLSQQTEDLPPEDINDGPDSTPSKRLRKHIPGYRKTLHGPMAIAEAGLSRLRETCPRFDAWVAELESLAPPRAPK